MFNQCEENDHNLFLEFTKELSLCMEKFYKKHNYLSGTDFAHLLIAVLGTSLLNAIDSSIKDEFFDFKIKLLDNFYTSSKKTLKSMRDDRLKELH